jgi:hypothetical protein
MIEMSDPLARLRAVNPVPAAEVALLEPDPVLFRRIVAGRPEAGVVVPRRRRPARRWVPALVVTSLLGGAVAYAVLRDEVTKPISVSCYEQADLNADIAVAPVGDGGPLAACAEVWRRGGLGTVTEVPPLVECTLASGGVGVFPATAGGDVCAGLDLPPVPSTTTPPAPAPDPPAPADVNARILAFRDATVPQFLEAACMTPQVGTDIVRQELERAGLIGWTITAEGFTAERPCATLSIQTAARQVILVPAPARR